MQESEGSLLEKALRSQPGRVGFEAVVPNPKLKLLDQVREIMRLRHYSIRTEQSYCDWIPLSYCTAAGCACWRRCVCGCRIWTSR